MVLKPVIYILQSLKNNRYYIGSTKNIEKRLKLHNTGRVKATKYILPLKLVFIQEFENVKIARQVEYKLKLKKSRIIIERIINDGEIKFKK